uniref:Uncharacterized protein n=1 Tax=Anguilla anguilla TaxID=7936 RepID=A0A0E9S857_ANGAN
MNNGLISHCAITVATHLLTPSCKPPSGQDARSLRLLNSDTQCYCNPTMSRNNKLCVLISLVDDTRQLY